MGRLLLYLRMRCLYFLINCLDLFEFGNGFYWWNGGDCFGNLIRLYYFCIGMLGRSNYGRGFGCSGKFFLNEGSCNLVIGSGYFC